MLKAIVLLSCSIVLLTSCAKDDFCIEGTWSRESCDSDEVLSHIFDSDGLVEPGSFDVPLRTSLDCGYLPVNRSTYEVDLDANTITFEDVWPEDVVVIFSRPQRTIWYIDSMADDYIRYISFDEGNSIVHGSYIELWRE